MTSVLTDRLPAFLSIIQNRFVNRVSFQFSVERTSFTDLGSSNISPAPSTVRTFESRPVDLFSGRAKERWDRRHAQKAHRIDSSSTRTDQISATRVRNKSRAPRPCSRFNSRLEEAINLRAFSRHVYIGGMYISGDRIVIYSLLSIFSVREATKKVDI